MSAATASDRPNSTTSVCLQPQHQTDQAVTHQYEYVCNHGIRQTKQSQISMSAATASDRPNSNTSVCLQPQHQTDQTYSVKLCTVPSSQDQCRNLEPPRICRLAMLSMYAHWPSQKLLWASNSPASGPGLITIQQRIAC